MRVGRSWADRGADSSHQLGEAPHAVDLERAIQFVGVHEQCAKPRAARADDIDVIEIAHMNRRLGATPCTFEREREEARVRFLDAFHERVADGVEVAEEPVRSKTRLTTPLPFETTASFTPRLRRRSSAGCTSGGACSQRLCSV